MSIIDRIKKDIDKLKVVSYNEEFISSDSKFITLKKGSYKLNNGKTIVRESVVKNVGSGCAACIFAVTKDKKILLVIHPRVVLPNDDKISVEIPAGYIEDGEDSIIAAKRELQEETGYSSDKIFLVDSYYPSFGISGERIDLFLAIDCEKVSDLHLDFDEFIVNETVSLDEYKELIDYQYIKGVTERMGYYHYLNYLRGDLNCEGKKEKE